MLPFRILRGAGFGKVFRILVGCGVLGVGFVAGRRWGDAPFRCTSLGLVVSGGASSLVVLLLWWCFFSGGALHGNVLC